MVIEAIRTRRSVRAFAKRPMEQEKIELLLEAALRAPSSRGKNSWEFVAVTERTVLEELSLAKPHGSGFLKDAALGIAVLGLPDQSDVWVEDCAVACAFIQLAAEGLGLGSCWIQIRQRNRSPAMPAGAYVASVLGIPAGVEVAAIIALGYPAERSPPRPRHELKFSKAHRDRFGAPFFPVPE